jgi:hypothetical protein
LKFSGLKIAISKNDEKMSKKNDWPPGRAGKIKYLSLGGKAFYSG